jgi:hypothetical protein
MGGHQELLRTQPDTYIPPPGNDETFLIGLSPYRCDFLAMLQFFSIHSFSQKSEGKKKMPKMS